MKRFLLALVLVSVGPGLAQTRPPYSDVPSGHWAAEAVSKLAEIGVLTGYPDGSFRGESPASRYELAMAVYRLYAYLSEALRSLGQEDTPLKEKVAALDQTQRVLGALEALGVADPDLKKVEDLLSPLAQRLALLERAVGEMGENLGSALSLVDALTVATQNATGEMLALRRELDALSALLAELVGRREFAEAVERVTRSVSTLASEVAALKERVAALEKTAAEVQKRLDAPPPFTLKSSLEARVGAGPESPRLLNPAAPLSDLPLRLSLALEREGERSEASLYLAPEGTFAALAQAREPYALKATLQMAPSPAGVLEGELALGGLSLSGVGWSVGADRGFSLGASFAALRAGLLYKEASPGDLSRLLGVPFLNPGRGFALKGGVSLSLATLEARYEASEEGRAYGGSLSLSPLGPDLILRGSYTQVEGGEEVAAVLEPVKRQSGFSVEAEARSSWGSLALGYEWLEGGSGLTLRGQIIADHLRALGLYRQALNALKVSGEVKGDLGPLSLSLAGAYARATNLWQAFLEGRLGINLEGALFAVSYTEAASLSGLPLRLWDRRYDPSYLGLFEPGSPVGSLLQEVGFDLGLGPLNFQYGLLLRPTLGDRFQVRYRLTLP
ncbi:S-layer protein SlpA [bacterium HR39]|nr:S-layer protein SlpA [bacterium HR39]